nr:hypothetical protein [Tumebacillus amylolyticus]
MFTILLYLTRSPILAILVLLVIIYVADRRFVGIFPSLLEPLRRSRRISQLRNDLRMNPNDTQAKVELARLLLNKKRYEEANNWLEEAHLVMRDSADVLCESGFALLKLGRVADGEARILEGLALNPRAKYGEPYLKLAEAYTSVDQDKALRYLASFQEIHSSSCEAYYRLGTLYHQLGRATESKRAFHEGVDVYRSLPKYKKRSERKWALRCWFKK